ncbi:MAG: hypothetical protein HFJ21_05210 [Clostridia bacterium]|nr:hypothetical protein [Clostridia bacterium]MCI9459841.1 hypothetical protein [Clostridia bacterium]
MTDDNVRKIDARVDIAYGNEEIADALEFNSDEKNEISNYNSLFNNRNAPAVKAFTLEGNADNALSCGRALIDPEIVGWWSTSFSSEIADGASGYPFATPPTLTVGFGSSRPVKTLQVFGDPQLGEYPTRFAVTLFRGKEFYARKEFTNTEVKANIDLTADVPSDRLSNGYIDGITRMAVEILAWNKPKRLSKIYRCYDDIIEQYKSDELKCFECIRELPNTDEIAYGLVSGSCSVTLYNKDRKFDQGYLKELMHINKRVVPYINGTKLGSFYIKEWDISQNDMFVKCDASDRLTDFRDIMYEGMMPESSGERLSFKTLFEKVLEYAGNSLLRAFSYSVDKLLGEWSIEPYLPRKSVWDVLQMLCEASMSFVYVGKDDVIYVKSELMQRQTPEISVKISPQNAFSVDIPFFADMEADRVKIPYFRKVVKPDQELYRINDFDASEGQEVNIPVEFDKFCEIERVEYKGTIYPLSLNKVIIENKISDFKYVLSITVEKIEDANKKDLVVYGKETTFEKQELATSEDTQSKSGAGSLYTHPDCELIQSEALAKQIRSRLKELYPTGTRSATATWRGAEKLDLLQTAEIKGRYGDGEEYMITQIKNTVDGGFKQEIKGVSLPPIQKQSINGVDITGGT